MNTGEPLSRCRCKAQADLVQAQCRTTAPPSKVAFPEILIPGRLLVSNAESRSAYGVLVCCKRVNCNVGLDLPGSRASVGTIFSVALQVSEYSFLFHCIASQAPERRDLQCKLLRLQGLKQIPDTGSVMKHMSIVICVRLPHLVAAHHCCPC